MCKPWPKDIKITLPVGKYSDEKVLELGGCWAQTVDLKHPHVSPADKAGLNKFLNDEQKELDSQEVNLEGCRKLRRDLSGGPDPSTGPKFKKGDQVTVVRKTDLAQSLSDNPSYRKDINVGMEGEVKAIGKPGHAFLKLGITDSKGSSLFMEKEVSVRNIQLTSEWKHTIPEPEEPGTKEPPNEADPKTVPSWVLKSSSPDDVIVEKHVSTL